MYFAAKILLTALAVAGISELSRKYSFMASLLASLPLTSILAFIWIYAEEKNTAKIAAMSYDIFWLVLPSLAFFLILPFMLKKGMGFPLSMIISSVMMSTIYGVFVYALKK